MTAILSRLRLGPYVVAIMAMVAVAALVPARGAGKDVLDLVVHVAIAILFFIYGQDRSAGDLDRISPTGGTTFVVFLLIGLGVVTQTGDYLDSGLATGLMFVCLLPSTAQSSIAFTSIARGSVPAALRKYRTQGALQKHDLQLCVPAISAKAVYRRTIHGPLIGCFGGWSERSRQLSQGSSLLCGDRRQSSHSGDHRLSLGPH